MSFFKNKFFYVLAAVLVLCLLWMANSTLGRTGSLNPAAGGAGVVVSSLQKLVTDLQGSISGFFSYFTEYHNLAVENAELKQRVSELEAELENTEYYKLQVESLQQMMGLTQTNPDWSVVMGEVIGKDVTNWLSSFTIDQGSLVGVKAGDSVVNSDGLVGTVSEVGPTWAKVSPLLQPDTAMGAMVVRSREVGIVEGDYTLKEQGLCRLSYLDRNANVVAGDRVQTSGLGGKYPKGLYIGTVQSVEVESDGKFCHAILKPAVDYSGLKEVYVIIDFSGSQEAAQ